MSRQLLRFLCRVLLAVGFCLLFLGCLPPPLPPDLPEVKVAIDPRNSSFGRPQQPNNRRVFRSGSILRLALTLKHFRLFSDRDLQRQEPTSFEKDSGGYAKVFWEKRLLADVRRKRFAVRIPRVSSGKYTLYVELVDHDGHSFNPEVRAELEVQVR